MKTIPDWQFGSTDEAPKIKSRLLVRIGIILSLINLLVVIAAPLAKLYLQLPETIAFPIFFNALQAGVILAALGLLLMTITALSNNRFATKGGLTLLITGLLPVVAYTAMIWPADLLSPIIHDITTDTENPPQFVEVKKLSKARHNSTEYGSPGIAARQLSAYPDLQAINSSMNIDDALTEAIQVVKDLSWEFINIDYDNGIVEAYTTLKPLGLVADIIIRVQRDGSGSRIDVRSASRFGRWDFGKNAEHIRQFIKTYRK